MTSTSLNRFSSWATVLAVLATYGCGDDGEPGGHVPPPVPPAPQPPPPEPPPAPTEGPFDGTLAADTDPAPDVVDVTLEARIADVELAPGRVVSMWTYDGVLPGPRIEARVGDLVRVRFTNALPDSTTVHWHGVRVPAAMDGAPVVQSPIAPGGSFTYEFRVPDAGTFWYHPHVRSDEQVERGLYGPLVVRGEREPESTSDRVVVLDDILLDESWQLVPFDSSYAMVGRQGNVILANGRSLPVADVQPGGLHRFRFVNAANARYFRLALPGARFTLIGTDGGPIEQPQELDEILLVPGERADVLVVAPMPSGAVLEWQSLSYDRGHETGTAPDVSVFQMRSTGEPATALTVPATLGTVPELPSATVMRELRLEEMEDGGGHAGHGDPGAAGPLFAINGRIYPDSESLLATLGDVEEWSIVNTTMMDHPFHLHGFRFQIVDAQGTAPSFRAWRDTINIVAMQTVRFRVRLETNPGTWMFHCHILEHAERGMMGELSVVEP